MGRATINLLYILRHHACNAGLANLENKLMNSSLRVKVKNAILVFDYITLFESCAASPVEPSGTIDIVPESDFRSHSIICV